MTVSDRLRGDDEYHELFSTFVQREAEVARLDGEELREAGFSAVQVAGQSKIIWRRGEEFYTTERALTEIRPTIEDD